MTAQERGLRVEGLQVELIDRGYPVRGVDFRVEPGQMLGIVGESGSGKSMTLRAIAGLLPFGVPARVEGRAIVDGEDRIGGVSSPGQRRAHRRPTFGYVFQEPLAALNPGFTVKRQLAEAMRITDPGLGRRERDERMTTALAEVRLPDPKRVLNSYPHQLSGGMRQRVVIALALVGRPHVLLADEPTTALDVTVSAEILDLILELQETHELATVLVSHDLNLVAERCDTVSVMYAGRVVEHGTVEQISSSPKHPYTRALWDATVDPFSPPRVGQAIPGDPPRLGDEVGGCAFAPRCAHATEKCIVADPVLGTPNSGNGQGSQPQDDAHQVACWHWQDVVEKSRHEQQELRVLPTARDLPPVLDARGVSVRYGAVSGSASVVAVDDVDLTLTPGEIVGIVGESGSGKSSLLRALAGMIPRSAGVVQVDGVDVSVASDRRRLASTVQMIFQDPYSSLNPRMTIGTAIGRALRLHRPDVAPKNRAEEIGDLLTSVGLPAGFASRYPRELSGGQRQRVAVARALAAQPRLLLADEPTSALDVSVQAQIVELLAELVADRDLAIVMITHDFAAVRAIASRVMVMHEGRIVEQGPIDELIAAPTDDYTRRLLAAVPSPTGNQRSAPHQGHPT